MYKILVIFKREYVAAVRTKSFIIGLIIAPFLMGGGMIAFLLLKDKQDTTDKRIVVIDHSEMISGMLVQAAEQRNSNEIFNSETGEKVMPAFIIESEKPDTEDPTGQQLRLSDRVRSKELHAFIEIGPEILHPRPDPQVSFIRYYSEHSFMDNIRNWFSNTVNNWLRQERIAELNLDPDQTADLFHWIGVEGMGLVTVDRKTGNQEEAQQSNELQSFLVPYVIVLLMFMLVMMSAVPLLSSVMEEKTERIAEVLLGIVTPFEFMMGKVLGSIAVSLTTAAVYVMGGIVTARAVGADGVIPYHIIPWFFTYTILFVIMVGSGMAALGATCNDNKDAQSLQFPAMIPVILPMFIMVPVIQNPAAGFATGISLFPPFTPTMMLLRLSTSVTIPAWQPVVGLAGVILFTAFTVWIGSRIFRTAILMQGLKPTIGNLARYALMK